MRGAARAIWAISLGLVVSTATTVHAQPELAVLAPAPADDARLAVAIGPAGEVYEPDGKGAWTRLHRFTTSSKISLAGRAGGAVVAIGDGIVYRWAPNGWTAIRLAQKGRAVMSGGTRAVSAVGRQLYSLDKLAGGEPAKVGFAAADVVAIGSGASIVVATGRGLFRLGPKPIALAAVRVTTLVSDQWALVDRGALDLRTGRTTTWPAGVAVVVATTGHDDRLVAVATIAGKLELLTLRADKVDREPIDVATVGTPIGVAVDRSGRAVVALRDGRIAVRERGAWTTTTVIEKLPDPRPGSPPAKSN